MNLLVFEQNKVYVRKCLENGEIDYLETGGDGVFRIPQHLRSSETFGRHLPVGAEERGGTSLAVCSQ